MAQPSLGDVHVDQALTDFSVAYFQDDPRFIARQFAPVVPSAKQSNKYYVYTKAETLRTDAQKRAPGTKAARRTHKLSTDTFFCDVYSIAEAVSEQVLANADPAIDPEEDAAEQLAQDIKIRMEVDFATAAFGTSIWGTDVTGGTNFTKWSDPSSTPIEDLATGCDTVDGESGHMPNTLLIGADVWRELRHHPDIIARLPDNAPRIATTSFLGNLLDLDRVLIARAIRNTAQEGLTASYSRIMSDGALLAYVDPSPGLKRPTAMRMFTWSGLAGMSEGIRTKRFDLPEQDAYPLVETDAAYDFKVTGSDLGYFFTDAV